MRSHLGVLGLAWSLLAGCGGGDGSLVVRAVSELGGTPIAGVNVQVGDRGWATTGSNGEVRFAGVTAPYTAVVHQPMTREVFQGTYQHDAIWKLVGQTANPLVVHVDGSLAQKYRSQLFGTAVGRSGNVGTQVRVGVASALQFPFPFDPAKPDGSFQSALTWEGSTASSVVLRALETDPYTGRFASHYTGYGASRVAVSDTTGDSGFGGTVTGVQLQLAPVSEARVTAQATHAPGLLLGSIGATLWLRFGEYEWLDLDAQGFYPSEATFDSMVPLVEGAVPWIQFYGSPPASGTALPASGWHGRKVTAPASGLAFDLPAPVSLLEPADGGTFGPSTVFRWSAGPPGGKYALDLRCTDSWSEGALLRDVQYRQIETTETEVTLPMIPGLAIPGGQSCQWAVSWTMPADPAVENRGSRSEERAVAAQ